MISHKVLQPLTSWKKDGVLKFCVGIDVGGSGFRIRLSNFLDNAEFIDVPHIRAQGTAEFYETLSQVAQAIHEVVGEYESTGAALAVAGPHANGVVCLTNWAGERPLRTIKVEELVQNKLFPAGKTVFLNDLEAGAYGIIASDDSKTLAPYFEQLWPQVAPQGPIVDPHRTALLAMGSGLGVSLILKEPMNPDPIAIPTELGHVQIAADCMKYPKAKEEYDLIQHVSEYYYDGTHAPEYEDICSGRGLCVTYQFFKLRDSGERVPVERLDAGQIAQLAEQGDKTARTALTWHYIMFIRAAKAVATSFKCDSCILALDNQVKNKWFVHAISDQLKDEFYHFIRPDWMKPIRVYSQIEVQNFNTLGADYIAHRLCHPAQ